MKKKKKEKIHRKIFCFFFFVLKKNCLFLQTTFQTGGTMEQIDMNAIDYADHDPVNFCCPT